VELWNEGDAVARLGNVHSRRATQKTNKHLNLRIGVDSSSVMYPPVCHESWIREPEEPLNNEFDCQLGGEVRMYAESGWSRVGRAPHPQATGTTTPGATQHAVT